MTKKRQQEEIEENTEKRLKQDSVVVVVDQKMVNIVLVSNKDFEKEYPLFKVPIKGFNSDLVTKLSCLIINKPQTSTDEEWDDYVLNFSVPIDEEAQTIAKNVAKQYLRVQFWDKDDIMDERTRSKRKSTEFFDSQYKKFENNHTFVLEWCIKRLCDYKNIVNGFESEMILEPERERLLDHYDYKLRIVSIFQSRYLGPRKDIVLTPNKTKDDSPYIKSGKWTLWPMKAIFSISTIPCTEDKKNPDRIGQPICLFKGSSKYKNPSDPPTYTVRLLIKPDEDKRIRENYAAYFPDELETLSGQSSSSDNPMSVFLKMVNFKDSSFRGYSPDKDISFQNTVIINPRHNQRFNYDTFNFETTEIEEMDDEKCVKTFITSDYDFQNRWAHSCKDGVKPILSLSSLVSECMAMMDLDEKAKLLLFTERWGKLMSSQHTLAPFNDLIQSQKDDEYFINTLQEYETSTGISLDKKMYNISNLIRQKKQSDVIRKANTKCDVMCTFILSTISYKSKAAFAPVPSFTLLNMEMLDTSSQSITGVATEIPIYF